MTTALLGGKAYREAVAAALADGWRFAGLHATAAADGPVVHALLVCPAGETRIESVAAHEGTVPTIVDLAPAAGWDEREAHDLYGVGFDGHEPLRPLVDHDVPLERFATPVRGPDPYQVAVGPIHAGVIESGHFRFHVVGDRILHVDVRLFYKHRGLERAAEGLPLADGLRVASRACAACWVTNAVAYAHACEELLGLTPTPELARARTILLELERVWNTLNDIGAVCAGVGLAAGNTRFAALVDDARRLNARLTGHRFLFGSVAVGGSALDLDAHAVADARETLARIRAESSRAWRELLFNGSFMDRMPDIGVVDAEAARTLGVVGPAARAAGLAEDARTTSPRLAYDGFAPAALRRQAGDVQARLEQRALELLPCLDILDRLLAEPVRPAAARPGGTGSAIGVGRVESARGVTSCVVERDGDRIGRLRLRTGSYANWPAVAHAAAHNLLPDFPLINKSFELCYACADR
ncbi:NiFe-hydrogenase III large subunit [Gaiella occulta]|uniref:NiFe-hydrogenase III large subunit n=1 Tax=Gaiella occulta TaxID=1002870 RepID=A0A7M2YZN4_9ACTN|nr:NADH-quinone oxidoreductase subunit C [Gaiella occulta]RDI75328.1 NiFe-hydrogenase III large subunit [Gaiella occulta]